MCSGSEAGSCVRLIAFVYHSTLGLRVIKKKQKSGAQPVIVTRARSDVRESCFAKVKLFFTIVSMVHLRYGPMLLDSPRPSVPRARDE